jgi:MOB kinase activator 1
MFKGKKDTTFRPIKSHVPGSKRAQYSDVTLKTLGSGDLKGAVKLPAGEDLNEWLAANTVDFFNELSLIWGIICDIGVSRSLGSGTGFPPGFEYRWADGRRFKSPVACSGPEYIDYVMTWVEKEINNETLFPTTSSAPFPKNFLSSIKQLYTRMFRIFAIIYCHHFSQLEELGAVSHLNTSFKHFVLFLWEYDLVAATELEALQDIIEELRMRYYSSTSTSG